MLAETCSFDGDWTQTPSSRNVAMELILVTAKDLDLDKDPSEVLATRKAIIIFIMNVLTGAACLRS